MKKPRVKVARPVKHIAGGSQAADSRKHLRWGIAIAAGFLAIVGTFVVFGTSRSSSSPAHLAASSIQQPRTYDELIKLSPDQLEQVDIGLMNLLCAQGLHGAENMDAAQCLQTLDDWAKLVDTVTKRTLFHFNTNPAAFNNSEGVFRMLALSSVLKRNLGVHYDPQLKDDSIPDDIFCKDANNCFICGALSEKRTGTCSSLPVLFVAVGRRLGYPLYLVATKTHSFMRWDSGDGKDRFNIEVTSDSGVSFHPDDYYKLWPFLLTEDEIRAERYLENMSAAEVLASFLTERGCNLVANNAIDEAMTLPPLQIRLAPECRCYHVVAATSLASVRQELVDYPRNFSELVPSLRQQYGVNSPEETNALAAFNQRLQRLEQIKVALASAASPNQSN